MNQLSTDRRTMLKLGALAAAPVAALAPAAVLASDDTRARLARLEDERAIREAVRAHLATRPGVAVDHALPPAITLSPQGSATYTRACTVERVEDFAGQTTVERMARFQGNAAAILHEPAELRADLARTADGWAVTRLAIA